LIEALNPFSVMAGLVPAIHEPAVAALPVAWMPGSSPQLSGSGVVTSKDCSHRTRNNVKLSWPDLIRPSTLPAFTLIDAGEGVDHRVKRGDDDFR
jgi:hypothetical protein